MADNGNNKREMACRNLIVRKNTSVNVAGALRAELAIPNPEAAIKGAQSDWNADKGGKSKVPKKKKPSKYGRNDK